MNLDIIRQAGKLNTRAIELIWETIYQGATLKEADAAAGEFLANNNAKSAFLGYNGYPANSCISIKNQIVHAIPADRKPEHGDLVKIDMGVCLDGWNVDAARTCIFLPADTIKLMVTPQATLVVACQMILGAGVRMAVAGNSLADIANAMQKVADAYGVLIYPMLGGHFIGRNLHQDPWIPMTSRAVEDSHKKHLLKEGDLICLEPIVAFDNVDEVYKCHDGWTIEDPRPDSMSAHFEHTLLITNGPAEIIC